MADRRGEDANNNALTKRVSVLHLRQRLGIEHDHEARIFGQGRNFFHLENWYSIHAVMRTILRLCLLRRRGMRNALNIAIRHNPIRIKGLPSSFNDFIILHLSDLHLDMHQALPQAMIERLRTIECDLAVLTGDFRAKTFGPYTPAMETMEMVRAHINAPVYGVLGNHDTIRMVPCLESMDIRMLLNESIAIERGSDRLYLSGIDDPHYYRADNLEKACESIPHEAISILLSHSPEIYQHAAHAGFDVMFCGHTHGGQICLPGGYPIMYNARCPRQFCSGVWQYHQLIGYTSVGAGVSIVDARLNCRPEITLHHLRMA